MDSKIQAFLLILSTLAITILSGPTEVKASEIAGIILSTTGPLENSSLYAYPDFPSLVNNTHGIESLPGEKAGQFRLQVKRGTYYLVARGELDGEKMFAYHGLNPVTINEDYLWLPFFAVASSKPLYKEGPQGIGGVVKYKDQALAGGVISAYPPSDLRFRGMGLLSNTIDANGRFWFDLEPGQHVIVARKRLGDNNMGPLKKGDLFCYPEANPIHVLPSMSAEIEISCYPRDDLEAFLKDRELDPRGRRQPTRRTTSLWDTQIEDASKIQQEMMLQRPVAVQGTVKDISGKPASGLYVAAYPADQFPLFQMFVVRLITNHITKTDENGRYHLNLEHGKAYYLVAREKIGEAPDHMELYGLYEGTANHSYTVQPGIGNSDVDVTVERIMP
jgi:hypothetical protein